MSSIGSPSSNVGFPFPPTDLTFDKISNPKQRQAALENQDQLQFAKVANGAEFSQMNNLVNNSTLVSDGHGHLSIAGTGLRHREEGLADKAAEKASDMVVERLIEKSVEMVAGEGAGGAVGPVMKLGEVLTAEGIEKRMISQAPKDVEWRQQRTIALVAEQMAPQARTDRHEYNTSNFDQRERLINMYNNTTGLLHRHYQNMAKAGYRY